MAVPKKKPSHTQSSTKESAWRQGVQGKLKNKVALCRCPHCNELKRSHMLCTACGEYGSKKKASKTTSKKKVESSKKGS